MLCFHLTWPEPLSTNRPCRQSASAVALRVSAEERRLDDVVRRCRAEAKLTLANIAYNFDRLDFHERRRAMW